MPTGLPKTMRLPCHITPAEDEALVSWIAHISAALGQSPLLFGRSAFGIDAAADPEWWRRPSNATLSRISARTGLDPVRVRDMTFLGWATARGDEDAERFGSRRWTAPTSSHLRGRRVDICRQCAAEDRRPYLRRFWMMGWAGACPRHRTILTGQCPTCRHPIRLNSLKASSPTVLFTCRRCGAHLMGDTGQPAHALALSLQDMLATGKRTGVVDLPSIGRIDWETLMATTDMLLGMIWTNVAAEQRERLFNRIARDISLGAADRVALSLASNYGGLLMLGWLLEDLGSRLPAAIAILRSPRFDGLLGRLPDVDDHMAERLKAILAPAIAKSPVGRGTWRPWIESLPESATDLRERAARERYKHRRQRLTALAELKDGATVVAAAAAVGVQSRSVYAWLDRGAEYGLEAALERPTGKPILTSAQAEALAQWIAADHRNQNRNVIVDHAAARFGIPLSLDAASKLLAKHGRPKPGRRRRLWRPKPQRKRGTESTHDPAPVS